MRYTAVGFNFAYLLANNNQRGPLDNTVRFSLFNNSDSFKRLPNHISQP